MKIALAVELNSGDYTLTVFAGDVHGMLRFFEIRACDHELRASDILGALDNIVYIIFV